MSEEIKNTPLNPYNLQTPEQNRLETPTPQNSELKPESPVSAPENAVPAWKNPTPVMPQTWANPEPEQETLAQPVGNNVPSQGMPAQEVETETPQQAATPAWKNPTPVMPQTWANPEPEQETLAQPVENNVPSQGMPAQEVEIETPQPESAPAWQNQAPLGVNPQQMYGQQPSRSDLLSIIAQDDEIVEEAPKTKKSIDIDVSRSVSQSLSKIRALYRTNTKFFSALHWVWRFFVSVILLSGLTTLGILIFVYIKFPQYVRDYFSRNNIQTDTLDDSDFTFSSVEIKNVRDSQKTYQIKSILLQYSVADLLKKQIKSATLDGVRVFVKETEKGFEFGRLPQLLQKLSQYNEEAKVRINTMGLTNASLELSGQKFKLPISFSMTGVYKDGADLTIPIWIKEDILVMKGSLNIKGGSGNLNWVLDISSGVLTLPGQLPENITGKISFRTNNNTLASVNGDIKLYYGENSKQFNLNLVKKGNRLFSGDLSVNLQSKNPADGGEPFSSSMSFNFAGINFKNGIHLIESDQSIQMNIQSFKGNKLNMSNGSAKLQGTLKCQNFACSYFLKSPSYFNATETQFGLNNNLIKMEKGVSFVLMPLKNENIFEFKNGQIKLNLVLAEFNLDGYRDTQESVVSFHPLLMALDGVFNMSAPDRQLSVNIDGLNYSTPEYEIKNGILKIDNLFAENPSLQLLAEPFKLKASDLIKQPFMLILNYVDQVANANLVLENGLVQASFTGSVDFNTGTIDGSIFVPTFELEKLNVPLSDLSGLFSPKIRQATGKVSVLGGFNWTNTRHVSGPLYVSLKDISAVIGNTKFSGLNTVLILSSLEPFITQGTQQVFIQNLQGDVPLTNVSLMYQFDNQYLYFENFAGYLGSVELTADTLLVPRRFSNATMLLRNSNVDLKTMNDYLSFPVQLTGRANVSLPIDLNPQEMAIKNGEIKLITGSVEQAAYLQPRLSDLLKNQTKYNIRNGTMLLNAVPDSDKTEIQFILEGKTPDSIENQTFQNTYEVDLNEMIKPMSLQSVPEDIVKKQELFDI